MRRAIRIPRIRILKFNAEESRGARVFVPRYNCEEGGSDEALRNHNVSLESIPR